jgi:hypothetical protein
LLQTVPFRVLCVRENQKSGEIFPERFLDSPLYFIPKNMGYDMHPNKNKRADTTLKTRKTAGLNKKPPPRAPALGGGR